MASVIHRYWQISFKEEAIVELVNGILSTESSPYVLFPTIIYFAHSNPFL